MSKESQRIRRQRTVPKKKAIIKTKQPRFPSQLGRESEPTVMGAPHAGTLMGVATKADAGEIRGDLQQRALKAADLNVGSPPSQELAAREARTSEAMDSFKGEGRVTAQATVRRARTVVIRNKRQFLLQSSILIKALEEAYDYKPRKQGNQPEPELWTDLGLDNQASRADIRELIEQLKQLNAHLAALRKPAVAIKDIEKLKKHLHTFLDKYAKTAGTGAGLLTIGAAASLLSYFGAGDAVAIALAWKAVNRSAR
jgi:hypothetical protein